VEPTPSNPEPPTPEQSSPAAGSQPTFSERAAARRAARPWYLQPKTAIWLGPVLIVVCIALRFGWGGLEGPPFPVWGIAYVAGAAGIFLTYLGFFERNER
jgi:hypothetical protein